MKVIRVLIQVSGDAPVSSPPPEIAKGIYESHAGLSVPQLLWLLGSLGQELKTRGIEVGGIHEN